MFTSNVGTVDRILRLVIGLILVSLIFIGPKTMWGAAGVILIITAFMNFCPIYGVFKLNTVQKK